MDILQRIITIDIEGDKQNQLVLINPEILESEGETGIEEGCYQFRVSSLGSS